MLNKQVINSIIMSKTMMMRSF